MLHRFNRSVGFCHGENEDAILECRSLEYHMKQLVAKRSEFVSLPPCARKFLGHERTVDLFISALHSLCANVRTT